MGSTHATMGQTQLLIFSLLFLTQCTSSLGSSLTGKDVSVTTILHEPFMMLRPDHSNRIGIDKDEGFLMDLLHEVSANLKFKTLSVSVVPDGKYGRYDNTTNSWNGMVGEVVNGNVDMAMADITITRTGRQLWISLFLSCMLGL